jgi:hypothetical protein
MMPGNLHHSSFIRHEFGIEKSPEKLYHPYNITSPPKPKLVYQSNFKFESVQMFLCAGINRDVVFGK